MAGKGTPFNVYEFRSRESGETEPMRYNVGGIRISGPAFKRLQEEISLETHALQLPRLWGSEDVKFYSGVVPIGSDIFRRIVIRASKVPVINSSDFSLAQWTEAPIYEVCTNPAIYAPFESSARKGN
jgi:hypothetical protein